MDLLSQAYPSLYIFVLQYFKKFDKITQYMALCKAYENDAEKFSLYIFGYWIVELNHQRQAGRLK